MIFEFYKIETPVRLIGRQGCRFSNVASVVRIQGVREILRLIPNYIANDSNFLTLQK